MPETPQNKFHDEVNPYFITQIGNTISLFSERYISKVMYWLTNENYSMYSKFHCHTIDWDAAVFSRDHEKSPKV